MDFHAISPFYPQVFLLYLNGDNCKNIFVVLNLPGKTFWKKKRPDAEDPPNPQISEKYPVGNLPPNYETFHQFVKSAYVHTLGLSGVGMLYIFYTLAKNNVTRTIN